MTLLDGKQTAGQIKKEIAQQVKSSLANGGKTPHLAAILVGEDGASRTYVDSKERDCSEVGFKSTVLRLPESTTQKELLERIKEMNENEDIDGLIVQLPLPEHIDEQVVIETIDPKKDVDGFHPLNVGKMVLGLPSYISATPFGIMELLQRYGIETAGKHCVIIGRSNIVGKPLANLLSRKNYPGDCTVTLCHSRTKDMESYTKSADIVVAALGRPRFLKREMVREGAVVIDVGITRVETPETKSGFRLVGDVDFENVSPVCSYITPVPGGVGPMTRVGLLINTLKASKNKS